ncbi:metallophosphatase family protein [Undibacterium sp. Jales W-56]|uniref:metallophosphoesterase family protein n=1 Tax=Undibacterium sp. Jales W-56 TaxID=2897325 RepID=UPI0021CE2A6F|nr:metallophosphoesterase family protein [Undibacterium sp. Jales W-56]MCU6435012.1 metallophosphatase family protein [Undibacterium sp. Jales W-56]
MLLAILTDLHANREAVEACIAHAEQQQAVQYAFLGDLIGYGADPAWVMSTVMDYVQRGAYALMGNHDIAILQDERQGMNPIARQVVEWTRSQLSDAQIAFIRNLPYRIELQDILLVHANAWAPDEWDYVDGVMEAMRSMHATQAQVTFCGHVHMPTLYHMSMTGKTGEFLPTPEHSIPLSKQRRWLVIPGSVGQPRDGNPAACYATFDTDTQELTYFRVPYDHEAAAKKIIAAGLPASLAQRLLSGN